MFDQNFVAAIGECGQQRLVGENIDATRQPLGGIGDPSHGAVGENVRALVAGQTHAEHQISADIGAHQRLEPETVDHPLFQLAHLRRAQHLVKFLLPEQHDLQQFVAFRFEVRQQPNLF